MNKDYYRVRLTKFERDQKIKFAEQILHGTSRRKVLSDAAKNLNTLSKQLGLKENERDLFWNKLYSDYLFVSHKSSLTRNVDNITELTLIRMGGNFMMSFLNSIEARTKAASISGTATPFYICTVLPDPAIDHKDYQGQVYIKQNWRNYITDKETQTKVAAYIRNHHIRTVEYITGPPVYLLTRPNCRHKLIPISVDTILHSSARAILKRYKPSESNGRFKLNVRKYNETNILKFKKAMDKFRP